MKITNVRFEIFAVIVLLFAPFSSHCQGNNSGASSSAQTIDSHNCDPFDLTKLKSSQRSLAVARYVAGQIQNAAQPIDLNLYMAALIDEISLAALLPQSCDLSEAAKQQATAQGETSKTNKQTGATAGADGTTSAVEQTGIAQLLSIAEENGSVTSNINGSTMTLSTSLYGLFTGFGFESDSDAHYKMCPVCVRLGASATFNVANSSDSLANATRKQIAQWELKYSLRDLSSRSGKVDALWQKPQGPKTQIQAGKSPELLAAEFAAAARPRLGTAAYNEFRRLETTIDSLAIKHKADLAASLAKINSAPSSATTDDLATQLLGYLDSDENFKDALSEALQDKGFTDWITKSYLPAQTAYQNALAQFDTDVQNLSKGSNGSITFAQQYPTTVADTSTSTPASQIPTYFVGGFDFSWQPSSTPTTDVANNPCSLNERKNPCVDKPWGAMPSLTVNLKSSFYPNPNALLNEKIFRGGQAALQFQWNLGQFKFISDPNDKSQTTFSFNGSYERMQENKYQKGKKADILLGSVKLTIPVANGVSFPLAVSFANAPEQQAKGSYVIGNFGVAFDMDKLAAILSASKH